MIWLINKASSALLGEFVITYLKRQVLLLVEFVWLLYKDILGYNQYIMGSESIGIQVGEKTRNILCFPCYLVSECCNFFCCCCVACLCGKEILTESM